MAKNSKQKTIEYKGARYMGILKEGKEKVTLEDEDRDSGVWEEFENESMGKIREFLTGAGINPDDYEFVIKYRIIE